MNSAIIIMTHNIQCNSFNLTYFNVASQLQNSDEFASYCITKTNKFVV